MCALTTYVPIRKEESHRFRDGIFFIYPQQNLFVTFGIFRRWLLSCILMSRVVRLLERAEEGCEGLKHGYYDLPCVHFLIFLCHDIKNKIDRLLFFKRTKFYKIKQNFSFLKPSGTRLGASGTPAGLSAVLVLFAGRRYYLRPIIQWNARSASGTACGLLERPPGSWNHPTGLRAP